MTPLLLAARCGSLGIAKMLIKAGADVNKAMRDGATAVYLAVEGGQLAILEMLIEAGADLNRELDSGATALALALLLERHVNLAQVLRKAGATYNADALDTARRSCAILRRP